MTIRRAFTVWYDDESGEMTRIAETPTFASESPLMRVDVYNDAIDALYARAAPLVETIYKNFPTTVTQ